MHKPTYYLWRNDYSTQEEYESAKELLTKIGFRTVTFLDGKSDADIHEALKSLIRNHWGEK